jgi:hypothetical protein
LSVRGRSGLRISWRLSRRFKVNWLCGVCDSALGFCQSKRKVKTRTGRLVVKCTKYNMHTHFIMSHIERLINKRYTYVTLRISAARRINSKDRGLEASLQTLEKIFLKNMHRSWASKAVEL